MTETPPASQAYLLRLWQAGSAGKAVWRASLTSVRTGDRCGFADLESLFVFLKAQTGSDVRPVDHPPSTET